MYVFGKLMDFFGKLMDFCLQRTVCSWTKGLLLSCLSVQYMAFHVFCSSSTHLNCFFFMSIRRVYIMSAYNMVITAWAKNPIFLFIPIISCEKIWLLMYKSRDEHCRSGRNKNQSLQTCQRLWGCINSKSIGLIIWGPWMSAQSFMTIHQVRNRMVDYCKPHCHTSSHAAILT